MLLVTHFKIDFNGRHFVHTYVKFISKYENLVQKMRISFIVIVHVNYNKEKKTRTNHRINDELPCMSFTFLTPISGSILLSECDVKI